MEAVASARPPPAVGDGETITTTLLGTADAGWAWVTGFLGAFGYVCVGFSSLQARFREGGIVS